MTTEVGLTALLLVGSLIQIRILIPEEFLILILNLILFLILILTRIPVVPHRSTRGRYQPSIFSSE